MLEKMGWSKGKGLGANEDGNQDFVRVKYKNDNIGLGYEDRDDGWTQHETSFENLLRSLSNSAQNSDVEDQNCSTPTTGFGFQEKENAEQEVKHKISGESLEQKSKNSRVRVHYKKFTKGKDLSQYSEKDLANIFGRKSLNCKVSSNDSQKIECFEEKSNEKECEVSHNFGVTTISSGTFINDYFKKKMAFLKVEKGRLEEVTSKPDLENIAFNGNNEDSEKPLKSNEEIVKKAKHKKKRTKQHEDEGITFEHGDEVTNCQPPASNEVLIKKKKKKSETENSESDSQNKIQAEKDEQGYSRNMGMCEANVDTVPVKKPKNKRLQPQHELLELPECDVKLSKCKKHKKEENLENLIEENKACVESNKKYEDNLETVDQFMDVEYSKKKSKRKKFASTEDQILQPIQDLQEEHPDLESNLKLPRNKKSREATSANTISENNNCTENNKQEAVDMKSVESNMIENSKKKSKRKKYNEGNEQVDIENHSLMLETTNPQVNNTKQDNQEVSSNETCDKPKKNKKSKNESSETNILQENKASESKILNQSDGEENATLENPTISEDKYIYHISALAAEQFRHTDMSAFKGSNLGEIIGYGLPGDFSINVKFKAKDEEKIAKMWFRAIDKYKQLQEESQPAKKKSCDLKRFKKKKVFKFV